ncbi:MAG: acyl-CoA thioesterase [Kineosporiaceae bacterium]
MTIAPLPQAAERTARLLDLLTLEPGDGEDVFVAHSTRHLASRVFGGQVLAQALVAAGRTAPPGRRPHSLHAYFLRPGDLDEAIVLAVERLRDGRSFSARRVQALQAGVPILSMIASFETPGEGPDHADPMPEVPPPGDLPSQADTWGDVDHPAARYWAHEQPLDLRFVTPSIFAEPQHPPAARMRAWWRTAAPLPAGALLPTGAPDGTLLHAAVAVYASDYSILEPVLRRHGRSWLDSGLQMASIDHAMWFHRPLRADDWVLVDATSPSASSSRGLCAARMFTADGRLVVSVAQEGLFRPRS